MRTVSKGEFPGLFFVAFLCVVPLLGACSDSPSGPSGRDFEFIFDQTNAVKWFGGDDRAGIKPRNVGVGQSVWFDAAVRVRQFGFNFDAAFDYASAPEGTGHEVDLVLNIREADGTILNASQVTVPASFAGGWVVFDLDYELEAATTYIFTCYLKDGEILELYTGVTGNTDQNAYPPGTGYAGTVTSVGADMQNWGVWFEHGWDFNFLLRGKSLS